MIDALVLFIILIAFNVSVITLIDRPIYVLLRNFNPNDKLHLYRSAKNLKQE